MINFITSIRALLAFYVSFCLRSGLIQFSWRKKRVRRVKSSKSIQERMKERKILQIIINYDFIQVILSAGRQ